MQGWKDEEVPRASKEKGRRPTCQDCLNPQRGEQADRLAKAASVEHMIIPNKVLSFV